MYSEPFQDVFLGLQHQTPFEIFSPTCPGLANHLPLIDLQPTLLNGIHHVSVCAPVLMENVLFYLP